MKSLKKEIRTLYINSQQEFVMYSFTCSSEEPNERHWIRRGITPACRAASTGGNSDLERKRLSSRRAFTLFSVAPLPLAIVRLHLISNWKGKHMAWWAAKYKKLIANHRWRLQQKSFSMSPSIKLGGAPKING